MADEIKGQHVGPMGAVDVTDCVLWLKVTDTFELSVWADPCLGGPENVRKILKRIADVSDSFTDADPDQKPSDDLSAYEED